MHHLSSKGHQKKFHDGTDNSDCLKRLRAFQCIAMAKHTNIEGFTKNADFVK